MANLKRCVLVSRIPVEDTGRELVLFNLHLEAYDSGEGKVAQTNMLAKLLEEEAARGNYVVAGGDFNQIFSTADGMKYAASPDKWQAGRIFITQFDGVWQFMMDNDVPSCRSLDQPYEGADKENFQYYLIDGFIVSANLRVEKFENRNLGFVVSDHNPVYMELRLRR
jgi:endonuclease/exonuclease/phosphatase family metal-dependent hydrolase